MSVEPGVVDANVLAYALNADVEQHASARALLEAAHDPAASLYVTSQILCEFFSIITNAKRFPQPSTSLDAQRIIGTLLAQPGIRVLASPASVVRLWMVC